MKNIILGILFFSSFTAFAQNNENNGTISVDHLGIHVSFNYSIPLMNENEGVPPLFYDLNGQIKLDKLPKLDCPITGYVSYHANNTTPFGIQCGWYVVRINTVGRYNEDPVQKYEIGFSVQIDDRNGKTLETVYGPDYHKIREVEVQQMEPQPTNDRYRDKH